MVPINKFKNGRRCESTENKPSEYFVASLFYWRMIWSGISCWKCEFTLVGSPLSRWSTKCIGTVERRQCLCNHTSRPAPEGVCSRANIDSVLASSVHCNESLLNREASAFTFFYFFAPTFLASTPLIVYFVSSKFVVAAILTCFISLTLLSCSVLLIYSFSLFFNK